MRRSVLAILLAGISVIAEERSPGTLVVGIAGQPSADVKRGLDFGEVEMRQTARLLGTDVRLTATLDAEPYGWIVASGESPASDRPAIHLDAKAPAGPCEFSMTGRGGGTVSAPVLWHGTLDRYGASELNERFTRRYRSPMPSEAWAAWAAVKAMVESALRRRPDEDPCAALARLRFDGHKGRPLFFDPASRILSQPTYQVRDGRVIGEQK